MESGTAAGAKKKPLATIVDTIVAPKDAFETLRVQPTWLMAFAVALLLTVIGLAMLVPAIVHSSDAAFAARAATDPNLAQLSPAQVERTRALTKAVLTFSPLFALFVVPLGILIQSIVMLIANAAGKGSGSFKIFWAASSNIAVPCLGLANIVAGTIAVLRGPAAFDAPSAAQTIVPSLALFAPAGSRLAHFLTAFNPFGIWSGILVALAMLYAARSAKGPAWAAAAVVVIFPGLLALLTPPTH